VMDRFMRGENIPAGVLAQAWRDTTQPTDIWDLPIYEEMVRAVRDANASLPREGRTQAWRYWRERLSEAPNTSRRRVCAHVA
jgi:hypothetical protein